MATYEYVDKAGNLKTVDASDANTAISSASDIASNSGVSLSQNTSGSNSKSSEPTLETALGYTAPTPTTTTDTGYKDINEEAIRRQTLSRYQGQIDATKKAYSSLLAETKATGVGRLGEYTAQQARGGLLGSDFGQAQTDKARGLNQKNEESVLSSQSSAIAAIKAQAEADARSNIAAKRTANQYGYEATKAFNAEAEARKESNLKKLALSLIRSSIDPQTMGAQLKEIAKNYRVSESDIINSYLNEKHTEDQANQKDKKYQALSAGSSIYDPDTGEMVYEGQKETPSLTPYQQFQATQAIQKTTQKNTDTQRELKRQASLINTAWDRYLNGESKDLNAVSQAIVTTYNKILDPTSVVRESEYARSAAGQSLLDQISGKFQQLNSGGAGLTEESLQEMVDLANQFTENSDASIQADNQRARNMADQFGLNSDFVTSSGYVGSDDFEEEW
jgi:hypothetical protein